MSSNVIFTFWCLNFCLYDPRSYWPLDILVSNIVIRFCSFSFLICHLNFNYCDLTFNFSRIFLLFCWQTTWKKWRFDKMPFPNKTQHSVIDLPLVTEKLLTGPLCAVVPCSTAITTSHFINEEKTNWKVSLSTEQSQHFDVLVSFMKILLCCKEELSG